MQRDERVIVPLMPHLGIGVVDCHIPPPFDRVVVNFEVNGRPYIDDFSPGELEPAAPVTARTA